MDYPKQIMKKKELIKMGFPEEYLMRIFRMKKQTIAWQMNPTKRNSPILFDTDALEKQRIKECGLGGF